MKQYEGELEMLEDASGSIDGIQTHDYEKGVTYPSDAGPMSESLAQAFIAAGLARPKLAKKDAAKPKLIPEPVKIDPEPKAEPKPEPPKAKPKGKK